jgi:two-component system, OmpR family, sensor histidine kinase TctE
MRWKWLRRLRLVEALLAILLPALVVLSLVELRVTARNLQRAADAAYDRSLLGALKSIDANVSTASGGLSLDLPYRLFEFFELTASGAVHYRVATADGLVELGSADLPQAPQPLQRGVPQFYDGTYFGEPVRVVAYTRELQKPTGESASNLLVVQVAESTRARREFMTSLLQRAVLSNTAFLLLSIAFSIAALVFVLRPLAVVSGELALRKHGELTPLDLTDLPADVRPVIEAVNQHMRRAEELATQQRAFLDDASHQLRTHLTTLRMQVDFALREPDPAGVREALAALASELQRSTRSTNQLLALGRSDTTELQAASFDLRALIEDVARQYLPAARAKGLDLGIEAEPHQAYGDAALLREALVNLVANAVAYTSRGAVTLSSAADKMGWSLAVEDTGPGVPRELRAAAGGRYLRPAPSGGGSGLGLAIAGSIAARHAGVLRLEEATQSSGLRATLWWPRNPERKVS